MTRAMLALVVAGCRAGLPVAVDLEPVATMAQGGDEVETDMPTEEELRAACDRLEPGACMALAWFLQSDEWGAPRRDEAYAVLWENCTVRTPDVCSMASLLCQAHPDVAPAAEHWEILDRACLGGSIPACFRIHEQFAKENPSRAGEAVRRACAHESAWACAIVTGDWEMKVPADVKLPGAFRRALEDGSMRFRMPTGFEVAPLEDNPHFSYQFAIQSHDGMLEIRYNVLPLAPLEEEYQQCVDRPGCMMADPNQLGQGRFMMSVANVSDGAGPPHLFPPLGVRVEFDAEWGAVAWFQPKQGFAHEFPDGLMVVLHRDGAADAMVIALFRDLETAGIPWEAAFHALTFIEPVGL